MKNVSFGFSNDTSPFLAQCINGDTFQIELEFGLNAASTCSLRSLQENAIAVVVSIQLIRKRN